MLSFFLMFNFLLTAQVGKGCVIAVESVVPKQNYIQSAQSFESLAQQGSFSDFYFNAACYWSLAGEKEQAMRCLELAAEEGFRFLNWVINEDDLNVLHRFKGWRKVIKTIETNKKEHDLEHGNAKA